MVTTDSGQSPLLLVEVLEILHDQKIDYAVIGALAASYYGAARTSMDADAVVSLAFPSLQGLEKIFKKMGFKTSLRRGDFEDPIPAVLAIHDSYGNRVDLLGGIRGLDPQAFDRTKAASLLGTQVRMIALEDFIAMKIFAGSPKDIEDAKNAIEVSKKLIKHTILQKVTRRYGKEAEKTLKTLLIK